MPAYDEQEYTKSFDIKIWKRLGPYLRPRRRAFALLIAMNLPIAMVDAALPLFQRYAVANFIETGSIAGLWPFGLAYFAVILLQAAAVMGFGNVSMGIEMYLGRDLRRRLFTHLQELSFSFYNVTPVGYLISRVMNDTNRIAGMLAWNLADMLWALCYLVFVFVSMLLLNWKLALVVILVVPAVALLTGYFQNRILHWNRRVRKLSSRITGAFNEGITGAKTSKTLVIEDSNDSEFRSLTGQARDAGVKAAKLSAVYIPLVLFCSTLAVAIVLYSGGHMSCVSGDEHGSVRVMCGISPDRFEWRLEGGESFEALCLRARVFLSRRLLPLEGQYDTVLVSAHGAILCALFRELLGTPMADFWQGLLPHGGVRAMTVENGICRLLEAPPSVRP